MSTPVNFPTNRPEAGLGSGPLQQGDSWQYGSIEYTWVITPDGTGIWSSKGINVNPNVYIHKTESQSDFSINSNDLEGTWSEGVKVVKSDNKAIATLNAEGKLTNQVLPEGFEGPQGPQGIQGPRGIQGPKGETGSRGERGQQGVQGIQGPAGIGINFKGELGYVGPPTDKPLTEGDMWIDTNDVGWVYEPVGGWISTGSLQGPQGPRGFQGIQGERGSNGADGEQGPQGVQGPRGFTGQQGAKGDTGSQGAQGPQGPRGPRGYTGPAGGTEGLKGTLAAGNFSGGNSLTVSDGTNGPSGVNGEILLAPTGSLEIYRSGGPFIDLKNRKSDDYDCRIQQNGINMTLTTSNRDSGVNIIDRRGTNGAVRSWFLQPLPGMGVTNGAYYCIRDGKYVPFNPNPGGGGGSSGVSSIMGGDNIDLSDSTGNVVVSFDPGSGDNKYLTKAEVTDVINSNSIVYADDYLNDPVPLTAEEISEYETRDGSIWDYPLGRKNIDAAQWTAIQNDARGRTIRWGPFTYTWTLNVANAFRDPQKWVGVSKNSTNHKTSTGNSFLFQGQGTKISNLSFTANNSQTGLVVVKKNSGDNKKNDSNNGGAQSDEADMDSNFVNVGFKDLNSPNHVGLTYHGRNAIIQNCSFTGTQGTGVGLTFPDKPGYTGTNGPEDMGNSGNTNQSISSPAQGGAHGWRRCQLVNNVFHKIDRCFHVYGKYQLIGAVFANNISDTGATLIHVRSTGVASGSQWNSDGGGLQDCIIVGNSCCGDGDQGPPTAGANTSSIIFFDADTNIIRTTITGNTFYGYDGKMRNVYNGGSDLINSDLKRPYHHIYAADGSFVDNLTISGNNFSFCEDYSINLNGKSGKNNVVCITGNSFIGIGVRRRRNESDQDPKTAIRFRDSRMAGTFVGNTYNTDPVIQSNSSVAFLTTGKKDKIKGEGSNYNSTGGAEID